MDWEDNIDYIRDTPDRIFTSLHIFVLVDIVHRSTFTTVLIMSWQGNTFIGHINQHIDAPFRSKRDTHAHLAHNPQLHGVPSPGPLSKCFIINKQRAHEPAPHTTSYLIPHPQTRIPLFRPHLLLHTNQRNVYPPPLRATSFHSDTVLVKHCDSSILKGRSAQTM